MNGACPACAKRRRKRVRASIRFGYWKQNREQREDGEGGGQASIDAFTGESSP